MIKILICSQNREFTQELFARAGDILRQKPLDFELTQSNNPGNVAAQLLKDPVRWDVLMLPAREEYGLKLAALQRRGDLTVSLIFAIKPLLRYRPGAVLTGEDAFEELDAALTRACAEQLRLRRYFAVKNRDMLFRVDFHDILYFESRQRVVTLHAVKQKIDFYAKLNDVERRLPPGMFVRCHQSYLVNIAAVRTFDRVCRRLGLTNGDEIEVSRSYYAEVGERIEARVERL